jgi:uncharacterized OsmC-like protein
MKTETVNIHDTIVNGVNVTRMGETITTVKNDPKIAKFQFRAQNKWIVGGHNQTTIHGFYGAGAEDTNRSKPFILDADEPPVLLGEDKGPNPVEYVLTALISCMTTTMVYHAAAQGIRIEAIESTLEGNLDLQGFLGLREDIRKGYENITIHFKVKSDASPETLAALAKNSPVYDVVTNPVPVSVSVATE